MVRLFTRRSLEELGYAVLEASSAEEALAIVDKAPLVDLIVSDVVMPGLSAKAMADAIEKRTPRSQCSSCPAIPARTSCGADS